MTPSRLVRKCGLYVAALLLAGWTLIPIYWLTVMAFAYRVDFIRQPTSFVPRHPTLFNFLLILNQSARNLDGTLSPPSGHAPEVMTGFQNSLTVATLVAILTVVLSLPAAYALGRLSFRFKNTLLFAIIGSRSLPAIAVVIPFYALFQQLQIIGTVPGLVLVHLSVTIPLAVWLMTGFFGALPRTAEREARVDGCTRLGAFWRVMVPMSRAGIAAVASMAFLGSWNEFTYAFILAAGTPAQTLPPALAGMFVASWGEPTLLAAAGFISILPPLLLAYVFQNQMQRLSIVDPL
jgi:multiple sugar transport system permease protein